MRRLSTWCALTILTFLALGTGAAPSRAQTPPAAAVVLRLVHQPAFNDPKHTSLDVQVRAVLGKERGGDGRFEDAARYLENLFMDGLRPTAS